MGRREEWKAGQTAMMILTKDGKDWVLTDRRTGRQVQSPDLVTAVRELIDPGNPWWPEEHFEHIREMEIGGSGGVSS
jgi:hypothetical protein